MQVLVRGEPKRLVNNLPSTYQVAVTGERSVKWLGPQLLALWPGLRSLAMAQSTRQDLGDLSGKVSVERRFHISSL